MPPKTASVDNPVCGPRTSASARIWATSSRVGATTRARGPRGVGAWRILRGDLLPEGVGVAALDAKHVAVHHDGVGAAQRLGEVGRLAFEQRHLRADRDDRGLHIAEQGDRFLGLHHNG